MGYALEPHLRISLPRRDSTDVSVLEASPDITRQIVDAAGEMIIATTLDGTITFLNARAQSVYGWTAQEAIGQYVTDLFVPAGAAPDAQAIMDRVTRGETWSGDFEVRRRDGSTFPAHVVDAPIFGSDGAVVGIVGV